MVLKNLNSVGCVIDENGVVYPMLADGGHDIFAGVHINDLYFFGDGDNEEFFDALSQEDIDIIEDVLGNPTDTLLNDTEADYLEMKAELAYGI